MKTAFSSERDTLFGQMMTTLRTAIGLTQAELAELLGVSRRAIGGWEAGESYPKMKHLKIFIELVVQHRVFAEGQEQQEIRKLWKAAHQRVLLDEVWVQALLPAPSRQEELPMPVPVLDVAVSPDRLVPELVSEPAPPVPVSPPSGPRVDWGDTLAVPIFYGREQEMEILANWIVQERCRMVSVLGMGGIGKSALAVKTMYSIAEQFDVVIFRSLRDAPSCEALLDECLQFLAPRSGPLPASLEQRITLLLEHLSHSRTLVVLDNLESLLVEGDLKGRFRAGFEGYERLLRYIAQSAHQSCLLLTSREKSAVLRPLEGGHSPVRSLRLAGLEVAAGEQLLAEKDLMGTAEEKAHLIELYTGNPLALRIVTEIISDLFGGQIAEFLAAGTVVFGSITDLLDEQCTRLSQLELSILYWLAILREPVTLDELQAVQMARLPHRALEVVDSLHRRSLIERGQRPGSFTLQSVVLEYITAALIAAVADEIQQNQMVLLIQQGLELAHCREYIRQAQERLLLMPLLACLQRIYQGHHEVDTLFLMLLDQLREREEYSQGYGPANISALLRLLRGHLRGVDLSRLTLRGAYLQGVEMQDASLAGALIQGAAFTEALDGIWAVAISEDGQWWAAGSGRGDIRVWSEGGQTLHLTWQAHSDTIHALAFSPDGRMLASGGLDGTIKLWDLEHAALLWTGRQNSTMCLAFSPDGSWLASGGIEVNVYLWDVRSGTNVQALPHPDNLLAVTWHPDGSFLATGCYDGGIRLWRVQRSYNDYIAHDNQRMQEILSPTYDKLLSKHESWTTDLAFSPDGRSLASVSWDRTVNLWDVDQGSLLQTLTGHTDRINRVAWSPDGRLVASAGLDQTIWLWDVEHHYYRAALHGHTAEIYGIAFTRDSTRLLSGSSDGTLRVWDVINGQCVRVMQGYAVSLYDLDWSLDGTRLACGGNDTLVTVWDLSGETPPRVLRGHRWVVIGVRWQPAGELLATSGWDDTLCLWDLTSDVPKQVIKKYGILNGISWTSDGHLLACGTVLQGVYVWEIPTCKLHWAAQAYLTSFRQVAWSPDNTVLAGGGDDSHIYIWDAADGTLLQRLAGHRGRVTCVAWSPNGQQLVSGSGSDRGGELFVWDILRGECVRIFEGFPGMVYAVVWCPDGDQLISAGSDGLIRWWNVASGECMRMQAAHQGTVRRLRISPDGRWLASGGDDGAIWIWNLRSGELVRTLRHDRPYERLDITGIQGLNEAQKATLYLLGAVDASSTG